MTVTVTLAQFRLSRLTSDCQIGCPASNDGCDGDDDDDDDDEDEDEDEEWG